MPDTVEDIFTSFATIAPLWDDSTWAALQARNFGAVEDYLSNVLSKMSALDWGEVYWLGILNGVPAFRGELDPSTWKNSALPSIGKAIIKSASPEKLNAAYASLPSNEVLNFHAFILSSAPGNGIEQKISWMKNIGQATLLNFFAANPLGLHFAEKFDAFTPEISARLETIPENIRSVLFSSQTPEIIKRIADQNNIPEDKLINIADLVGLVFLGFFHPEELAMTMATKLALPNPTAKAISDSLNTRLFRSLQNDLDKIYAPLLREHEQKIGDQPGPAPKTVFRAVSDETAKPSPAPMKPVATSTSMPAPTAIPKPAPTVSASSASPKPISAVLSSINPAFSSAPAAPGTKIPAPSEGKFAPFVPANQPKPAQQASSLPQTGWSKMTTPGAGAPGEPAPVILHEDAKFSTNQKTTDFHLARPGGGAEVPLGDVKSQQTVKPAVLELGTLTGSQAKPAAEAPKFTHYSQFQVSTQPINRQVTEVTAAAPKAAAPSIPASSVPATTPTSSAKPAMPAAAPVVKPSPVTQPAQPVPGTVVTVKPIANIPVPQPPTPPAPPKPGAPPIQKNYP